jgi:hypothetical protein
VRSSDVKKADGGDGRETILREIFGMYEEISTGQIDQSITPGECSTALENI